MFKHCPLLNLQCLRDRCAWWSKSDSGDCAMLKIDESLYAVVLAAEGGDLIPAKKRT